MLNVGRIEEGFVLDHLDSLFRHIVRDAEVQQVLF